MIRDSIDQPWREVSWDEAIAFTAEPASTRSRPSTARSALGGITSSRCTNEETFLVQKLVRAAFGTNNVDTCARVCHSPTGYGLKTTFGTSAGTQDFDSVMDTDVMLVIGANPTDAHPVFASRMKRRLRQGAKLIVIDPRRIDLVRTPHIEAAHHLPLQPGTNVAVMTSLAHVIVTEGLANEAFIRERCDWDEYQDWARVRVRRAAQPRVPRAGHPRPGGRLARRGAALCDRRQRGDLLRPRRDRAQRRARSTVMAIANLAMCTGNIGRPGVGVNPLRGQNNVQGACDMGSFPHELAGYRHISDGETRALFEKDWGVTLDPEPGLRIPNMLDAAVDGTFKAIYIQGEDILQSDPNTKHVSAGLAAMDLVIVHDLFLNETANYAHVFLPGSTFLEKNGTFTNAERRIQPVRKVMEPANGYEDWEVTQLLANAIGADWNYTHPSEIIDEIARLTPSFAGLVVGPARRDRLGAVAGQRGAPRRLAGHARRGLRQRQGQVRGHRIRAHRREDRPALSAAADHRAHPQPVQRRRADAAHRQRAVARGRPARDAPDRRREPRPQDRRLGAPRQPHRRDHACACWSPTASRRAWSTPPSTTRRRRPTWSPPTTPTGRPIAPSTRSPRCRSMPSNGPSDWQEEYTELSERSRRIAGGAEMEPAE